MNAMLFEAAGARRRSRVFTFIRRAGLAAALALSLAGCGQESPSAFIASARQYMAKGDFNASIIQLKNALLKDPRNSEARYLLGVSELKNGDAGAAEIELRKAADLGLASDDLQVALARAELEKGDAAKVLADFGSKALTSPKQQAELLAIVGMAQLSRNDLEKGSAAFTRALGLDASDVTANLGMARIAASKGDMAQAMDRVNAALAASADSVDALMLKAGLLETQGQNAPAEEAYRKAIPLAGNQVGPRLGLITLLVREGFYDKASKELTAMEKVAPRDARTFYAKALLLVSERKYAAAKEAILTVLKVAPNHVPSLLLAATTAMETGAYGEAENYLRRATYQAPDAVVPRRMLAAVYLRLGKTDLAMAQVKDLLGKDVRDPSILALAGEISVARGEIAQAAKYYDEAKALAPKNALLQTRLAELRFARGDRDSALAELESISASHPREFQSDLALITAFLRQGDSDKALAAVKDLEKKQPENPLTYNLQGLALILKKDFAGARASFEHALQLQPTYMPAVTNLARLDLRDHHADAARKRYETVLQKEPNNQQALLNLAVLLRISGAKQEEIAKLLKQAVTGNPTSPIARTALVNFYLSNRDFKSALAAAQDAQAALPNQPAVIDALGVAQLASDQSQAAISTFAQLAGLLPKSPEPLVRQAQAYMAAKRPDDAIRALRQAIAVSPDQPNIETQIAAIYVSTGRSDQAMQEARAMQAKQPDKPLGYVLEAEIDVAQKKLDSAIRVYRDALKKFDLPLLVVRTHAVMEAAGEGSQADSLAEGWIKQHPKDVTVLSYLAQRDLRSKKFGAAEERLKTALALQPDNPLFLNNLAWAMYQLKQPKALEYAEHAHNLAPDNPPIMDTLGSILVDGGQSDRGLELLGRASELAPNAYDIRMHFAKALIKAGRKDAARKELEVLAKLDKRLPVQQEATSLLTGL